MRLRKGGMKNMKLNGFEIDNNDLSKLHKIYETFKSVGSVDMESSIEKHYISDETQSLYVRMVEQVNSFGSYIVLLIGFCLINILLIEAFPDVETAMHSSLLFILLWLLLFCSRQYRINNNIYGRKEPDFFRPYGARRIYPLAFIASALSLAFPIICAFALDKCIKNNAELEITLLVLSLVASYMLYYYISLVFIKLGSLRLSLSACISDACKTEIYYLEEEYRLMDEVLCIRDGELLVFDKSKIRKHPKMAFRMCDVSIVIENVDETIIVVDGRNYGEYT